VAAAVAVAAVEEAREEREGEAEKAMSGRKGLSFSFFPPFSFDRWIVAMVFFMPKLKI
jgi:hypothetical protein